MHVIEQNESIMCDNQINQSLNHKITYLGPPPQPVYFAWINITNSIIPELWEIHLCLLKSRGVEDCVKTRMELKPFERKSDFWNLFENWSLKNYLKIGVLKIKFENENFGELNLKLAFWKLFEN